MAGSRTPITVVTGFLGSGKTTLLAQALAHVGLRNSAVLVNEYGQAGLDHRLLRRVEERTRLLSGGCICCGMREDLIEALKEMLFEDEQRSGHGEGDERADRVIIETTGLADPAPIQFSLLMDPILMNHYVVDRVVCTLDAVNGGLHLHDNPESVRQLVAADVVVITKTDLVPEAHLHSLMEAVAQLNPAARIFHAALGEVDAEAVFLSALGAARPLRPLPMLAPGKTGGDGQKAPHNAQVRTLCIRFHEPLDWTAFGLWLSMLLHRHGVQMLRVKGIVDVGGDQGPIAINGVQHVIHPPQHLESWQGEARDSQIVFIMKELEPALILRSLKAFQNMLGAVPEIEELSLNPFG